MGVAATPATVKPTTLSLLLLLILLFTTTSTATKFQTFTRSYHTFNKSLEQLANSELKFENEAKVSQDALQVTPDSANDNSVFDLRNRSGRVMFKKKFKLWDTPPNNNNNQNDVVASFNTSFLVNMFPKTELPGEGLAFVIAPSLDIPDKSYGQYLGLTNQTLDNQTTNGIVAVELDTVQQDFDIDDNHIGLNIHSVRSVVSKSLTPLNITIAPLTPAFHNVWIQYDGVAKIIRVYIADQPEKESPTPPMPNTPIIQYDLDLRKTVSRDSYIGFAASTGTLTELNCILRWNLTVVYFPGPKSNTMAISLGIGIPVVGGLLALAAYFGYYFYKKRMLNRSQSNILSRLRTLPGMPKEYHFRELKKATNNFDDKRKLGQGGYGVVYRGVLPEENEEVAVKWFSRESLKGEDDFLAELTIINRLRHKHLVRLLGWCHKNGKLLLVYEYMRKGSLDMHLFTVTGDPLSWSQRRTILIGVASALHYLHYEYDQKVVHRDIKASNIMLDSNFNARLGDFGLARALDNEKTSYAEAEGVLGTVGYIAPECFHTGKATQHSDIYAFGALLIEVVSGQRPGTKVNGFQFMVDYVWSLYREGRILDVVDKRIADDYNTEEAERLLLLGLACSHPIANERPKTHAIVQILNGSMPVPKVPHFKPAFVWPAMMSIDDLSQATSIDTTPLSISQYETDWSPMSRENYSGYTDRSMV
ncbi:probable L-type lectin-domain containing receptor kinase S.5 [Rutidosis leptorrhynchoides]|uniref:probable L-type lectin-domain containing receptor kinase S.5 n=1 Tax=Rutidosis leptorrhynchoides TaxID=125765 RepID=UPI003A9A1D04